MSRFRLTNALVFCALLALPAWGQSTAEVRGRVTDASHQPVVSAFVIITAPDTSFMRAATTDDAGEFEFASLPIGTYHLRVKADGFLTFEASRVRASIGQVVNLVVVLSQKQDTTAFLHAVNATMIEAGNAQLGVVMGDLDVTQLPLKSRDTFDLLQLQPGVQGTLGADLFFGNDQPGVVSVNGGRSRSNNSNVNGGHAGDQMVNSPSIQPSPDSVSEFRVISHNYEAALGRNSGSVLNVITKSGTTAFHGSAYEFLRNNTLNAKGYFDSATPDFKQNEFGGTFGGPIRHDKTVFFSSYEGRRVRRGISSDPVIVPTFEERAGNFSGGPAFSGVLNSAVVAQTLARRAACAAAVQAHGGASIAAGASYAIIFPGNIIPSECFDPTAVDLMNQFVPRANTGNDAFRSTPNAKVRQDQVTFRLDHNLTSQQQLSLYYYGADGFDGEPFSRFMASGANLPGFGNETGNRFQQLNLSHVWTLTAKTSNEARFVYYREGQGKLLSPARTNLVQDSCVVVPTNECFADPANPSLGITPGYGARYEGVPFVSLAGGFAFGNNQEGNFSQTGNVYQGLDTYSRIVGKHTLKVGADIRNQRLDQLYFYDVSGSFSFTGDGANDVGFSSPIPNYLLGLPDTYQQGSANAVDVRTTQLDLFAQDAWKLRPSVTLSYGLRWEWNTPQADAGHRIQAFRSEQATRIYPCVLNSSDRLLGSVGSSDCSPQGPGRSVFPLGMVFPGDPGVPVGLTNNYLRAFAPRLGLAWSPDWSDGWLAKVSGGPGKSSIRLGWGMFYDSNEELLLGETFTAQPPFGGSTALSNVFLNAPFLGQDGSIAPNPFHGFLDPKPGSPVDFALFRPITLYGNFPPTLRNQYSDHYHVTVQRELARDTLWQFGYVGSQGHRVLTTLDQNFGNPQTCLDLIQIPGLSCGRFGADHTYSIPAGAIPPGVTLHLPYGSVPTVTGPNANPITLVGLRKYSSPFCEPTTGAGCPPDGIPVFGSIFGEMPVANSSYNSFQTLVNQRWSHGLQFLVSYTWSRSMDNASSFENAVNPIDPQKSRSLSLFDARHRMVVTEYWRTPDWRISNWTRHLAIGWALSCILTIQSGFPIRLTSSDDEELMSSFGIEAPGEPDQIALFRRLNPQKSGGYYFDPASFVDAPLGQIGNAPRTICCGPGIANLDVGVHKIVVLREGLNLEFRTEIFNVLNHTQFFNPDGNVTDGTSFGRVSRARDPRLIQLAVRLTF
ncbi:MAG: carboxypeptidase regulatory-like domain-containing protein [Acidobacteriia bacterium]|nr:carboxypeptidase regulatory-like domain-containing protein [Terriglobia bacterium]